MKPEKWLFPAIGILLGISFAIGKQYGERMSYWNAAKGNTQSWSDGYRYGRFATMQDYYEANAYLGPLILPEGSSTVVSNCWFLLVPPAHSAVVATNEVKSMSIMDCFIKAGGAK